VLRAVDRFRGVYRHAANRIEHGVAHRGAVVLVEQHPLSSAVCGCAAGPTYVPGAALKRSWHRDEQKK
jgi:hypothetical protein